MEFAACIDRFLLRLSSPICFSNVCGTTSLIPSSSDSVNEPFPVSHAPVHRQRSPLSLENYFCWIFPFFLSCVRTWLPANLDFLEIVYSRGLIMSFSVLDSKSGLFSFLFLSTITTDKLIESANYTSWVASVEL